MLQRIGGQTANNSLKQTVQANLGVEGQPFICERPTLPVGTEQLKRLIHEQLFNELTAEEEETVS